MSGDSRAVFISYASEDSEVAQRIADALRAAGTEVWFDKSELRGGDAWDQMIRHRIRDCRLFIPVISANSEARLEGYFRREWKLAADRMDDMASKVAFVVPVVVDGTSEADAEVPERFRQVQWIRLRGGEPSSAFTERVQALLSTDASRAGHASVADSAARASAPVAARTGARRRWPLVAAGAVLCAALGYLALGRHRLPAPGSTPVVPATAPADKSVAVLPLKNESGDPKQEYFSDGLSENLINSLSRIPEFKVIGRTSAFHFKNSPETSASIGRQLGAQNLVEGSVQREGATIRVSIELINAADGRALWSERFDRPYRNLFALQDEIAQALAQSLKAHLLPAAPTQGVSDRPPSGNLDAYALLLKGRYHIALGDIRNQESAVEVLRRAVQLDPNYAAAWIDLSVSYYIISAFGYVDTDRNRALAVDAIAHAMSLAPGDASVRYLSAILKIQYDHDPKGAAADIAAAKIADPAYPMPEELAIVTGCISGDCYQRYIRQLSEDIGRDPLATVTLETRGLTRYFAGDLAQAESDWRRILVINPDYEYACYYLAQILIAEHKSAEALAVASKERLALDRKAARAFALVALGKRAEAEAELRDMIAHDANDGPREIAEVYAALGEKQQALDWLQRDYDGLHAGVFYLRWNPLLRNLRDEPRFKALMDRIWPGS